jgi:Flp pilus assembly protein TadG
MNRLLISARRALRRFRRAREGQAAVELALLALPFFLLTVGLAEIAAIGFAQATMSSAVDQAARRIRVGEVQLEGVSSTQFRTDLCNDLRTFMNLDCAANLYLDVDTFASFVDAQNNNPISNGNFNSAGFGWDPGAREDIVVVRVFYRWKVMTPFFQPIFQNVAGGERIIASTLMFRNEPF